MQSSFSLISSVCLISPQLRKSVVMSAHRFLMVGCLVGFLLIGAVLANQYYAAAESTSQKDQSHNKQDEKEKQNNKQFHTQLLKIANEYTKKHDLIDNNTNWAPEMCAAPSPPPSTLVSKSDDKNSHGQKLYLLFAAKRKYYLYAKKHHSPIGQAIVKESWEAIETDSNMQRNFTKHASGQQVTMFAKKDKKFYHAGKQKELFIMYKVDPQTKGTDKGWVYGTVTADGKTVTGAGQIQSCMECHKEAGVDRLFGPKNPPPDKWYQGFDNIPEGDSPSPL